MYSECIAAGTAALECEEEQTECLAEEWYQSFCAWSYCVDAETTNTLFNTLGGYTGYSYCQVSTCEECMEYCNWASGYGGVELSYFEENYCRITCITMGECSLGFYTCEECEETCAANMEAYCEWYAYDAEEAAVDEEVYSECMEDYDADYCLDYCNFVDSVFGLTESCEYLYNDCNHCVENAIEMIDEWCRSSAALETPFGQLMGFETEEDCLEYYENMTYGYFGLPMCIEYCSAEYAEIVAENYEAPEVCEELECEAEIIVYVEEETSGSGSFMGTVVTGLVVVGAVGAVLYFFVL